MKAVKTLHEIDYWQGIFPPHIQQQAIDALEQGNLLFLPRLNFDLNTEEQHFLSPDIVDPKTKNISYDAKLGLIKGVQGTPQDSAQIQTLLARFHQNATTLMAHLFPHYQNHIQPVRTSFRPVQVSHRKTSYRKDDRRLHVDAFPANPNQGRRILRLFSNINPHGEDRVWHIGEPFEQVAKHFLPQITPSLPFINKLLALLKITKGQRTEYDHIMLQLHDKMKKDSGYQQRATKTELRLPPCSSWIVATDQVSHAALSGQYLLEQTFYLPVDAMINPSYSPLKILERLTGKKL